MFHSTASQMCLLARLLPAMVGRFVPEEDKNWCNLLLLLRITAYFSPKTTCEEAEYVVILIEHHQEFRDLYPNESITPKFHYVVHMPRLISMSMLQRDRRKGAVALPHFKRLSSPPPPLCTIHSLSVLDLSFVTPLLYNYSFTISKQ